MNTIKFIPTTFENIDFKSVETKMCPCSPNYSHELEEINTIKINIPEKILSQKSDELFIPVCIVSSKSYLRTLKYHNLSEQTIHIKPELGNIEYSGDYFDKRAVNKTPLDINSLLTPEGLQQQQQRIEEAQKLSDDELNDESYFRGYLNVNALDFVDVPIKSGKYEVWVTYYGLESNHAVVEIIIEGEEKIQESQTLKAEIPNENPFVVEEDLPMI